MKKTILLLLVISLTSICNAQFKVDAKIGTNLSGIPNTSYMMKFGLKAGIGLNYGITDLFGIKSGVYYSMKGVTNAGDPFEFNPDIKINLNYIEVPLMASFNIKIVENFNISLNPGVSFGYLISEKPAYYENVNPLDISAVGGLDLVFKNKFIIGIESQFGITELSKNSQNHNVIYTLLLGYRF